MAGGEGSAMGRRAAGGRRGFTARAMLIALVILVTLALIGLTVAGAFLGPPLVLAYQVASLDSQAGAFLTPPDDGDKDEQPYVRGRIVLIDAKKGHIDPFWRQLPAELIARTKDEVGTVLLVDWEVEGATANAAHDVKVPVCKLTVIDRDRNRRLGDFVFPWEYTYTDARRTAIQARRPVIAVADYIKSLPRR
jgi:hypothetical protein